MTTRFIRPAQLHRCILLLVLVIPWHSADRAPSPRPAIDPDHHAVTQQEPIPGSLPLPLRAAFSANLGWDDPTYHLMPEGDGGYTANNLEAGLSATLNPAGMSVRTASHTWSLRLNDWGRGDDLSAVTKAGPGFALANRLEYAHGALTEWYVNGPLGLQQGWTLLSPPLHTRHGPLTLSLSQSGTLHGRVDANGSTSLVLADGAGVGHLRYGGLLAYDATGRALPAWLEVRGDQVLIQVDDAGASYPVTVDPWLQACKLTTRPGADEDHLGWSVAVSANGDTVVVGVPNLDLESSDQGAVYVYAKPNAWASTPLYTARLSAGDGASGDKLGWSVSVSADGSTVVAGAPYRNEGGSHRGAAYVFIRPDDDWQDATHVAKLTAGDGVDNDEFGASVAVSGDGSTIVAGAPGPTSTKASSAPGRTGASQAGAAYVYSRPASGWSDASHTAKLTAVEGAASDALGTSVAASDDGSMVVAGAPFHAVYGGPLGAAFVYTRPASGWVNSTETARLMSGEGYSGDRLGWSVAVSGDGTTVVAGAPRNDPQTAGDDRGAAYVYVEPGDGWVNTTEYAAKLTADDAGYGDNLGHAVATNGNGDTVCASAPYNESETLEVTGAAYVFTRGSKGWYDSEQPAKLTASDDGDGDRLGWSVALSADGGTAIAGAPRKDVVSGGNEWGAAYVFSQPSSSWANRTETARLTADRAEDNDLLGASVAASGDGRTVVVGAPHSRSLSGAWAQGAVYVYTRPASSWASTASFGAKLTVGDGSNQDEFGYSVAVSGDGSLVIAGARGYGTYRGATYVYTRPPGGWASTAAYDARLTASDGADGDKFGESVAVSGDGNTVVVGAPGNHAAYVFTQPASGWVHTNQTATLTSSTIVKDEFGESVAVSEDGSTIISADPWLMEEGVLGMAYVYVRPPGGWVDATETAELTASGIGGGKLGHSVAVSRDGLTVVAGAPDSNAVDDERGLVVVFTRPPGGWVSTTEPDARLNASDGGGEDHLGYSVAVSGDGSTVVGGAPEQSLVGDRQGAFYVYTRPTNGWADATETAKVTAGDGVDLDMLGSSVAVSDDGNVVIAGAPSSWTAPGSKDFGAAYVYVVQEGDLYLTYLPLVTRSVSRR